MGAQPMTYTHVSFRPDQELKDIFDGIPYKHRSKFIIEACKQYAEAILPGVEATPKGENSAKSATDQAGDTITGQMTPGSEGQQDPGATEEVAQDFQQEGSLLEPPTQPKQANSKENTDKCRTASEDPQTSASPTTTGSEKGQSTQRRWMMYLRSEG